MSIQSPADAQSAHTPAAQRRAHRWLRAAVRAFPTALATLTGFLGLGVLVLASSGGAQVNQVAVAGFAEVLATLTVVGVMYEASAIIDRRFPGLIGLRSEIVKRWWLTAVITGLAVWAIASAPASAPVQGGQLAALRAAFLAVGIVYLSVQISMLRVQATSAGGVRSGGPA